MKKILIISCILLAISISFHIYRRSTADFFHINGSISTDRILFFKAEGYELLENGFQVEVGNFLYYYDDYFEGSQYIHRFRILGVPVKYRKVDYSTNYCYGYPGIPGRAELFTGWVSEGKKRYNKYFSIISIYKSGDFGRNN